MQRYDATLIGRVRELRALGRTYAEIRSAIGRKEIPKSTLSEWCKSVILPPEYTIKVTELNIRNLHKGRLRALVANKIKREKQLEDITRRNIPISLKVHNKDAAKIALAMLCLGEATKLHGGASSFSLGNSDPRIIQLFIHLLMRCFPSFSIDKIRCTVQCRADQDIKRLEKFWINVTGVPQRLFYPSRIDPRTVGKPTKKENYKGVLRVDYFDSKVWQELESLADLVYNEVIKNGPEV